MKRLMIMMICGGMVGVTACESQKTSPEEIAERAEAENPAEAAEVPKVEASKSTDIDALKEPESPTQAAGLAKAMTAKVGEPAPDFTLMDEAGNEVKLSQFKGKPVVLEWTEKSCPYVVRHYTAKTMPGVIEQAGGSDKVVWLAVDSSHFAKGEEVAAWKKEQGFDYPVLVDADGKVGGMYGAKNTPHMFVIDKEGVLRYSGAIDDNPRGDKKAGEIKNYVSEALRALEAGEPIENAETKPYGCSVKYKS